MNTSPTQQANWIHRNQIHSHQHIGSRSTACSDYVSQQRLIRKVINTFEPISQRFYLFTGIPITTTEIRFRILDSPETMFQHITELMEKDRLIDVLEILFTTKFNLSISRGHKPRSFKI